jgi:hypothetical protein
MIDKPSKHSTVADRAGCSDFGLRRHGIYRLMFASRTMAAVPKGSELNNAAMETFGLVLEALGDPAPGFLRERHALSIWTGVHGVVMLAEQRLLTGEAAHVSIEELVEDMVKQTELALSVAIRRPAVPRARQARTSTLRLLRRPRVDRRGAADTQNILQQFCTNGSACRGGCPLQSDRQARGGTAGQRQPGSTSVIA